MTQGIYLSSNAENCSITELKAMQKIIEEELERRQEVEMHLDWACIVKALDNYNKKYGIRAIQSSTEDEYMCVNAFPDELGVIYFD